MNISVTMVSFNPVCLGLEKNLVISHWIFDILWTKHLTSFSLGKSKIPGYSLVSK